MIGIWLQIQNTNDAWKKVWRNPWKIKLAQAKKNVSK